MKKLYLAICLLLTALTSNASHELGAEIRYEYTGGHYVVELSLYTFCGANLGAVFINYKSSCGANMNRLVQSYKKDTMNYVFCPGTPISCLSGPYVPPIIYHYRDTLTLATCSQWIISYTGAYGQANVLNILNPYQRTLYVEAFLNNNVAPNSSPVFGNYPVFFTSVNSVNTHPLQILDIEGDSITGNMINPQDTVGTNMPYNIGYSITQQLGSGSTAQLNVGNGTMTAYGGTTGLFLLEARVYDYRNGTMVGYSSRTWVMFIINGTNPKAPLPLAGTNFSVNTCPGQTNSYTYHFVDSSGGDSVFLAFTTPNNGITYTTSYLQGPDSGSATISWTTPTTYNPTTNPYFFIKLFVKDNKCPYTGFGTYNILVHATYCSTDSVWAGDANADKVVNMYDPLFVALASGATGAVRPGATTAWSPQWCSQWANSFNTGINYMHADCDGSGTVNNSDVTAISTNYGMTHPRGTYEQVAKQAGVPDLFFDHAGVNIYPGATVNIPIKLGSSSNMATLYGLAARINISGITPGSMAITYPSSWIGTTANSIRFAKSTTTNSIDWACARNDHQNGTGFGTLATLSFTIPAGTAGQQVILTMTDSKMINAAGADIAAYNILSDTLRINATDVGSINNAVTGAVVLPNPSKGLATLQFGLSRISDVGISVTDITGKLVWQTKSSTKNLQQETTLPTGLTPGMYLIEIATEDGRSVIKWMCE